MNERVKMIVAGVLGLVVGGGAGGFWGMTQVDEKQQMLIGVMSEKDAAQAAAAKLRRDAEDAPKRWGKDLGRLVMAAGPAAAAPPAVAPVAGQPAPAPAAAPVADDPAKTLDAARAVLAQRDTFRSSLDGVRAQLGGDMDALAMELGNATPDMEKVKALLGTLKANWPGTEKELENVTRKLFADMGLGAPPKPAAAPAPAAAAAPPAAAPAAAPAK